MVEKLVCVIPECSSTQIARGWCPKHYQRWQRKGSAEAATEHRSSNIHEAFAHYTKPEGDCLVWTGGRRSGYGKVRYRGRYSDAHRVAYELEYGPIPQGVEIDHACFTRPCVKIGHLRAVTRKQNQEHSQGAMSNSKSGVRGVYWSTHRRKWVGEVGHNGKIVSAGGYDTLENAEWAVVALRNKLHTHNDRDRTWQTS